MTDSPDQPGKRPNLKILEGEDSYIEQMASGGFMAFWRGKIVYENGRVKRFQTEDVARAFLARCDAAGKIVH